MTYRGTCTIPFNGREMMNGHAMDIFLDSRKAKKHVSKAINGRRTLGTGKRSKRDMAMEARAEVQADTGRFYFPWIEGYNDLYPLLCSNLLVSTMDTSVNMWNQ